MAYTQVNWENLPTTTTPINKTNLKHMDDGIKNNDDNISTLTSNFETGTFTPIIKGDTTAGTASYTMQQGKYVRIGKVVHIEIRLGCTLTGSSGLLLVGGLPFNVSWVETGVMPVITTLTGANNPWLTRVYGRNLILGTCNLGNITDKNWSSTSYIYITGTLMMP